ELAHSIGLEVNDLDVSLPIVYGSTGNWTVIVPIKNLEALGISFNTDGNISLLGFILSHASRFLIGTITVQLPVLPYT
ncbi:hypothetical protein ACT453_59485, partial [Bacillus sp. D-CC]